MSKRQRRRRRRRRKKRKTMKRNIIMKERKRKEIDKEIVENYYTKTEEVNIPSLSVSLFLSLFRRLNRLEICMRNRRQEEGRKGKRMGRERMRKERK